MIFALTMKKLKILFCGKDRFEYHRTAVIIKGLQKIENVELDFFILKSKSREEGNQLLNLSSDFDYVFVPSFRHKDVRWVKRHSHCPLIFDPLISTYLTKVIDYKHYHKAPIKFIFDRVVLRSADILLADTAMMKEYYHKIFKIPLERIIVVPVGFIEEDFQLINQPLNSKFTVGFYGSFVPLQGSDIIVEAARILKNYDISFVIIGSGAKYNFFKNKIRQYQLENIDLKGWLPYRQLAEELSAFDIALGIFGASGKAKRVIPNKLFHYAALGKCIITADHPAIHEIFSSNTNIVLIPPIAEILSQKILELREQNDRRYEIGQCAQNLIRSNYSDLNIANIIYEDLTERLKIT